MAGTPKLLAQTLLDSSDGNIGTVPAGKRWVISLIHAANIDSTQRTFRVNHVQSGGSSSTTNRFVPDCAIPVADMVEFGGGMVLGAGDALRGLCDSANKVNIAVYGLEESTS